VPASPEPVRVEGGWHAWCPACGGGLFIEDGQVAASEADPTEWQPQSFIGLCGCQANES